MSVIENFLVNTSNFDTILQTLINDQNVPSKITDTYFKSLGFQNPSDLLVIHLMKGLNILEKDGSTNKRFKEFREPSTTQKAVAKGIVEAYEGLFRMEPQIYKMQREELQKIFSEVFAGQKSELIFKYMANTFSKLVSYAGVEHIQQILSESDPSTENTKPEQKENKVENEQDEVVETVEESVANTHTNGIHRNGIDNEPFTNGLNGHAAHTNEPEPAEEPDSEAFESPIEAPKEERGDISFEDLVGLNSTNPTQPETQPVSPKNSLKNADVSSEINQENLESSNPKKQPNLQPASDTDSANNNKHSEKHQDSSDESNSFITSSIPVNSSSTEDSTDTDEEPAEKLNTVSPEPVHDVTEQSSKLKDDTKLHKALIKKADLLYKLERYESLLPTLDQIIEYFDRANEPFLSEAVSSAIIRRAFVLYKLNKHDQALPALDRVITRFSYSDSEDLYDQASLAMLYKANILEKKNRPEQVLPLFNSIVERLGHTGSSDLKEQIDDIFLKRLDMLLDIGRTEEVLAAADQLIERFKHSQDKLKYLEEAMFRKAEILENMNKYEDALEAYSNFLEKFGQNNPVT